MRRPLSPLSLTVACGLVLVTNAWILASVGWNRGGERQAELALTERELALPEARQDEGTALELRLRMSHQPPGLLRRAARGRRCELPPVIYDWLDRAKLLELGFTLDLEPGDPDAEEHYQHVMPRRAWVVLEYDGPAWRHWLERREEEVGELRREVAEGRATTEALTDAEAILAFDRKMRSRLFPVDAGTDADALRRQYSERDRYAVVEAVVRPGIVRPETGPPLARGEVLHLTVDRLHVPRSVGEPLQQLLPRETWEEVETRERKTLDAGWPSPLPPRYRAVIAVGRRHEPWLVDVDRSAESAANVRSSRAPGRAGA